MKTAILLCTAALFAASTSRSHAQGIFKPVPYGVPTLKGNTVTPARSELGKMLFFDPRLSKSGIISCNSCHNLGGVVAPDAKVRPPGDRGRFAVTKTETDNYVFRASPLRNIALTAPYFHSGQVWDLQEAVAIMSSSQLGATLTDTEIDEITEFLRTLTGKQPVVQVPILPVETTTTPRPQP